MTLTATYSYVKERIERWKNRDRQTDKQSNTGFITFYEMD